MWIFPLLVFVLHSVSFLVEAQSGNQWWHSDKQYSSTCCECVPFFGCVNMMIDIEKLSKHERSKEPTVNVQSCPNIIEYCCRLPNVGEECDHFQFGKMPPEINTSPQPDKNCECTPWETCPLEDIITDGKGKTSKLLLEIGLVSHSKCTDDLDVCCLVKSRVATRIHTHPDDSGIITPMEKRDRCICVKRDLCSESITNGVGVIEPRKPLPDDEDEDLSHEICDKEEDVCCPVELIIGNRTRSSSCKMFSNYFTIILSILILIKIE